MSRNSTQPVDLAKEEWRDVVGYEGYYQVSNYGRVKSLERTRWVKYPTAKCHVPEKLLSLVTGSGKHIGTNLWKDGQGKQP